VSGPNCLHRVLIYDDQTDRLNAQQVDVIRGSTYHGINPFMHDVHLSGRK